MVLRKIVEHFFLVLVSIILAGLDYFNSYCLGKKIQAEMLKIHHMSRNRFKFATGQIFRDK